MINTDKIRGLIAENGLTQGEIAEKIGMTPRTFSRKMKLKIFTSDEMYMLIGILGIEDPVPIFFAKEVS